MQGTIDIFLGAIWGLFFILGQWGYSLTYPFYRFYSRDIMDYYGCFLNQRWMPKSPWLLQNQVMAIQSSMTTGLCFWGYHPMASNTSSPVMGQKPVRKATSGWLYTYPSEKYESVGMMKFHGSSHHQPVYIYIYTFQSPFIVDLPIINQHKDKLHPNHQSDDVIIINHHYPSL